MFKIENGWVTPKDLEAILNGKVEAINDKHSVMRSDYVEYAFDGGYLCSMYIFAKNVNALFEIKHNQDDEFTGYNVQVFPIQGRSNKTFHKCNDIEALIKFVEKIADDIVRGRRR